MIASLWGYLLVLNFLFSKIIMTPLPIITKLSLILFIGGCGVKHPETPKEQRVSEKEQIIQDTNQEYKRASVLGLAAKEIKPIATLESFYKSVQSIEGIHFNKDTGILTISQSILFPFNSSKPKEEAIQPLSKIAEAFYQLDQAQLQIYGHTDNIGSKEYNQQLSLRRAEAIAEILVRFGIPRKQLECFGLGFSSPIASNKNESGRAQNRRVEFKVVQ